MREKATSGALWTAANQLAMQCLHFGVGLVLAILLPVEEFGLLAMVTVFVTVSAVLVEGGFAAAVIQKKDLSDVDSSTAFWFNLAASGLAIGILYFCAPAIAAFYREEQLTAIIRVMSIGLLLGALVACQKARMNRELQFKKIMQIELPALVVGAIVGIWMALAGHGVWALVGQALATSAVHVVLYWTRSGWWPRFAFSGRSFREMFGYGSKLAAARTLDEIFNNLYVLVIGRIFAPVQVGYYQRAKSFQLLPARNIYGVVEKVMFPLMSAVQSERERMNRAFDGALRAIVIVTFPIFVGMAVVAEPMILTLIGEKWRPAVPFLQVLCIVGALWPVQSLNLSVLRATGHSGKVLWLGIVKKALVAIAILLTWRHGIAAMIWGQVAVSLVALVLNTHYNRRLIGFPLFRQMRVALPYALAAAAMGAAVWALVQWVPALPVVLFGAGVLLGALVYTALLKAMQLPENRQFTAMVGKYPVIGPLARFVFGQNP